MVSARNARGTRARGRASHVARPSEEGVRAADDRERPRGRPTSGSSHAAGVAPDRRRSGCRYPRLASRAELGGHARGRDLGARRRDAAPNAPALAADAFADAHECRILSLTLRLARRERQRGRTVARRRCVRGAPARGRRRVDRRTRTGPRPALTDRRRVRRRSDEGPTPGVVASPPTGRRHSSARYPRETPPPPTAEEDGARRGAGQGVRRDTPTASRRTVVRRWVSTRASPPVPAEPTGGTGRGARCDAGGPPEEGTSRTARRHRGPAARQR